MTTPNATLPDETDGATAAREDAPGESQAASEAGPTGTGAESRSQSATMGTPRAKGSGKKRRKQKRSLFVRMEAFVSRLSTRNTFWHRVCSLIWLPSREPLPNQLGRPPPSPSATPSSCPRADSRSPTPVGMAIPNGALTAVAVPVAGPVS